MDYKEKYLKYKRTYMELKEMQIGGNPNIIIHISGSSGSGKTTIGNKLKDKFGNKIIVKDIDDLRDEFIKEYYGDKKWTIIDKIAYQKYIDNFINEQNKPIVFVGLNNMPWWHKNHYYNMHSNYNFYIEIDDMTIVKRKCLRLLEDIPNDEIAMNDLINNNENFVKRIKQAIDMECSIKETIKMNKKWNENYKKQNYKFMNSNGIYESVCKILDDYFHK